VEQDRSAVHGKADQLGCSEAQRAGSTIWLEDEPQSISFGVSSHEGGIH